MEKNDCQLTIYTYCVLRLPYSRKITEFNNRVSKYIKNIHKDSKTVRF